MCGSTFWVGGLWTLRGLLNGSNTTPSPILETLFGNQTELSQPECAVSFATDFGTPHRFGGL